MSLGTGIRVGKSAPRLTEAAAAGKHFKVGPLHFEKPARTCQ